MAQKRNVHTMAEVEARWLDVVQTASMHAFYLPPAPGWLYLLADRMSQVTRRIHGYFLLPLCIHGYVLLRRSVMFINTHIIIQIVTADT
jgi:hypothetical protein